MALAWITGANGLIGSHLVRLARTYAPAWQVIGLDRAKLELTDEAAVRQCFAEQPPDLIIHCAALSKTPACESNPRLAYRLNYEVTELLAGLAANIPFFFFSTDLVFDGQDGNYTETAPVHPINVYGETKAAAEKIVLANPRHTVIRTSLTSGASPTGDRSFTEEMRRAWREGRMPKLFTDEFRCPIAAPVTARAVWDLVSKKQPGLYHVAGKSRMSRLEIGLLLAARCQNLQPKIEPSSLRDYTGPPRAPDTSLNCAKAQKLLSFPLPGLVEWLTANPHEPF